MKATFCYAPSPGMSPCARPGGARAARVAARARSILLGAVLVCGVAVPGISAWASAADTARQTVAGASGGARVPTTADPLRGLDLWRGAKVGMSVTRVQSLFPLASPSARQTVLTDGETERLRLDAQLDGRPVVAHFFFSDEELRAVELSLPQLEAGATSQNLGIVQDIARQMSGLYGETYDCGDRRSGNINLYKCAWIKQKLSIQLLYLDVAGQAPIFFVAYRQVDDPGYNL